MPKTPMLFRRETCIDVRHRLKLRLRLETWRISFFIHFEPYEPLGALKFENSQNKGHPLGQVYGKVMWTATSVYF